MESKKSYVLHPGEQAILATRCRISSDRDPKFSLYVKECEKSPFKIIQEGGITDSCNRIKVAVMNTTDQKIYLPEGYNLAYLIMSPYYM